MGIADSARFGIFIEIEGSARGLNQLRIRPVQRL
jgi:hypothetical protein